MAKKIRTYLRSEDGRPCPHGSVLAEAVAMISEAPLRGEGMRLTAEMVRALDWAIIREEGGYSTEKFRDGAWVEVGEGSSP